MKHARIQLCILRVHCDRLLRAGDSQIKRECLFLREKVFRLIQDNSRARLFFIFTKTVLAKWRAFHPQFDRPLSELEAKELIVVSTARSA
jgi:hypothetical protein